MRSSGTSAHRRPLPETIPIYRAYTVSWRRGRDSNPRYSLRPYDALAKRCLQPLGHLSGASLMHLIARAGQFGSACFRSNIPSDLRNETGSFSGEGRVATKRTRSGARGNWGLAAEKQACSPQKLNSRENSMVRQGLWKLALCPGQPRVKPIIPGVHGTHNRVSPLARGAAVDCAYVRSETPRRFVASSLSLLLIPRFASPKLCRTGVPAAVPHVGNFDGKGNRSKNMNINNMLWGRLDHICVLFVQHPSENTLHRARSRRSLVVCARAFGNCDWATEGGIPRSSRLGHSLKSLAFMRVCPKARRSPKR